MSDKCVQPNETCSTCGVSNCAVRGSNSGAAKIKKKIPQVSSHIGKIIGVLSGKGGVGKSFVTASLAVDLAKKGYKVGIMDADVTGPSVPRLFSINEFAYGDEEGMYPCLSQKYEIKIMSVNLMLESEDTPVLWRGPIVGGVVDQFYTETYWGDLDYLLIDMPPGTSDVALSVLQDLPLDGIVMVSTPSKLVSMVVSKAIVMSIKQNVPIIGLVDNMSYVKCPDCGKEIKLYQEDATLDLSLRYDLPVLAMLPIDSKLSTMSDEGLMEDYDESYLLRLVERIEELEKREVEDAD